MKRRFQTERKVLEKNGKKKDFGIGVKLPKLKITTFTGKILDFKTDVDQVQVTLTSKFSYLKKFFALKLRLLIYGIPFTSEGYARVKSILTFRYGKPSKVAAARIHYITSLPVISNCSSNHIQVFFMIL